MLIYQTVHVDTLFSLENLNSWTCQSLASEKNDARHASLELVWLLKIAGWLSRESNMATEKQKKLS
jgi:hypothetical protein